MVAPPHSARQRLAHRVGRRGYFLILLTVVCFVYGFRMVVPETPSMARQNQYLAEILQPMGISVVTGLWVWAVLWWIAAGLCAFSAFRRDDFLGFGSAFAVMIVFVAGNAIGGFYGMAGWATRCFVWAFIASTVIVIGKWPEPHNSLPEVLQEIENSGEIPVVVDRPGDPPPSTGGADPRTGST